MFKILIEKKGGHIKIIRLYLRGHSLNGIDKQSTNLKILWLIIINIIVRIRFIYSKNQNLNFIYYWNKMVSEDPGLATLFSDRFINVIFFSFIKSYSKSTFLNTVSSFSIY